MTARKITEVEEWQQASTLGETVFKLVQEKKTNEAEFKALLDYFGRKRLLEVYEEEKKRRSNDSIEV